MTLWLNYKPQDRACAACGEGYEWQLEHGALVGTCSGCGRDFAQEHRSLYYELIDAHPDWPSDELARIAAQDYNRWLLAAWVAQHS